MITGRVIEFETGKPIQGAFVWYGYDAYEYVVTDSNGNFSVNVAPFTFLEIVATGKKPLKDVLASSINGTTIQLERWEIDSQEDCTLEDGDCAQTVYGKKPSCVWCWLLGIAVTGVVLYSLSDSEKPKEVEI